MANPLTPGTTPRYPNDKFGERKSLQDFAPDQDAAGVIGDGSSHPLSDFYGSLGAAQARYSFVTSLTHEAAAAALQLGINYFQSVFGGRLYVPDGDYLIHDIILREYVWIQGAGYGGTRFKMPDGKNADMLTGYDFDALYATIAAHTDPAVPGGMTPDLTMGIWSFGIDGITLDGNKANNTSGHGVRVYGWNYALEHLRIKNFSENGLMTGWAETADAPAWSDFMESRFVDLKIHNNDGHGWKHHGPHDSIIDKVETYENGDHGFWQGRNGASFARNLHSYGPTQLTAWRNDEIMYVERCTAETANDVQVQANAALIGSMTIFSTASLPASVGLKIGQVLDAVPKTVIGITRDVDNRLVVEFSAPHGLFNNNQISITGVVGIDDANYDKWPVLFTTSTKVTLQFSEDAVGTYTSGGSAIQVVYPNGFDLDAYIYECGGGLIDTTYATGGGNAFKIGGFLFQVATPLVFSDGTTPTTYAAALARLAGADLDIWINGIPDIEITLLHLFSKAGGDIQTVSRSGVGAIMTAPSAANEFQSAFGWNLRFDGTTWRTVNDEIANGGAGMLFEPGEGRMRLVLFPSTGAAVNQTFTPAQLLDHVALTVAADPLEEAELQRGLVLRLPDDAEYGLRMKGEAALPTMTNPWYAWVRETDNSKSLLYSQIGDAEFQNFIRTSVGTAVSSRGVLTFTGLPSNAETVTIDGHAYTFKTTLASADDVLIGATAYECARNLANAINDEDAFEGTRYGTGTTQHATCSTLIPTTGALTVIFRTPGTIGDGTVVSEALSNATWSGATLTGGVDGEAAYVEIIPELRLPSTSAFENNTYLRWKDSVGTPINQLGMDGSNNFHVGAQVAPDSAGDTFHWARGDQIYKLVWTGVTAGRVEPILTAGLELGSSTKLINHLYAHHATFYSVVAGATAQVSLHSADAATFVNLRGALVGANNYNLCLPPDAPPAAGYTLISTSTSEVDWVNGLQLAEFIAKTGSNGALHIHEGSSGTVTGYIEWRKGDGTRLGYMGNDGAAVPLVLENGAKFYVTGGTIELDATVKLPGLTALRPLVLDASRQITSVKISLTNADQVQASGLTTGKALTWSSGGILESISGVTSSPTLVTGVTAGSSTLNYLDHASAPQSMTVLNSISPTSVTANFTEGIWTS